MAAIEDSPGDQANFDDSSPALNANAAGSPKSPTWGEMAQERPLSPGGAANGNASVVHTMTPPRSPSAGGVPATPGGVIASPDPASPAPSHLVHHQPPTQRKTKFSAALADVTAAAERLAEKAKKARAKAERKKQGGKLLLQQLQDEAGAKDPSLLPGVMRAPAADPRYVQPTMMRAVKTKIWGVPPPVDPQTGLVPIYDASAVKQSTFYKLKGAKRRSKQQALVAAGKARKRPDEEFDALWARVQRQEALLNKIKREGKRYAKAMEEMATASRSIAASIVELAEIDEVAPPPDEGADRPAGTGASREQVAARARQLADVMDILEADVRPACVEQLTSSVTQPLAQLCEEFPAYQPCVDKRRQYMLDMDAYERKLNVARQQSRDPGQLPHREEQFSRAQRRFSYFSDKLVEDLTLLDANRFELAGFLLEGFVETQEFTLQRHRDAMSAMSVGKLPQRTN